MHNLSMAQALGIWEELVTAYHQKHGFGTDTAEIYIYRLMPNVPQLPANTPDESLIQAYRQACRSLVALIKHFESTHNEGAAHSHISIRVVLDGGSTSAAATWIEALLDRDSYLNHRIQLQVKKNSERRP